jgi:arginine N-succinyltransferase
MEIVRLAQLSDLNQLYSLIDSEARVMTTMPKSKENLKDRIEWSVKSSLARAHSKAPGSYLMVLESKKKLVGISAIYTKVASKKPSVFFKIKPKEIHSKTLNFSKSLQALQLHHCKTPYTELGTLFLSPKARSKGVGKLLSLSRLCFMGLDSKRFDSKTFVEIRGWKNKEGESDFWNHFSKIFFDIDFDGADSLSYIDNHFISEAVPKLPFFKDLIPNKARKVIGKPHENALPAQRILEKQGFYANDLVDVFDAGPCLEAVTKNIAIVKKQSRYKAKIVTSNTNLSYGYLTNCSISDFRCIFSGFSNKNGFLEISKEAGLALQIKSGDAVSMVF